MNYGLRYEIITPWYDTTNKLETAISGVQSVVFPGAPLGYLVPGDPESQERWPPSNTTNLPRASASSMRPTQPAPWAN